MTSEQDAVATETAIKAAIAVVDAHMAALNSRDPVGLAKTLHFPHYRLAGGKLKVWETPDSYFDDFLARAGDGWVKSAWDKQDVIAASPDKVHLDMAFTRFRGDDSTIGSFRSIWVIAKLDGRWAAQLRSSFAS
jgi:hypothetical protein